MSVSETILRVAARGDGVTEGGRHVAFTAPGDTVSGDVITPGPHHQTPPCRHFPQCGGCQLQHLDEASYSDFVEQRVRDALHAQGLDAAIRPATISPPRSRRRATLHAERVGKRVILGFSESGSHALVDIAECHVLLPELFALVAPLRVMLANVLKAKGRTDIHLAAIDQGVDLLIGGPAHDTLAAAEALTEFAIKHRLARVSIDEGLGYETRWEPEPATITLGGVPVAVPPAAFLQATAHGEAALLTAVREAIGPARLTADLFAGLGTFALSLPGKVYAGEAARDAILALKSAASMAGRAVFAEHRDLFRRPLTTAELDRFEAVVLDPPRAGARDQIVNLAPARVPRIAYVSCNPSSFARDAKLLCEGGYRLDWVQPVGQFIWSTHVELAAAFSRPDNPQP
ncbi:class I SAM-dependent RNA methyltransferase [Sphingomonas donggukensis]|uniref:Class I SAM-dependent RNA methyltransferase n=1 Tax=Sphingomonas donggukensis TaxID=2949093 RepID=A0ABY4TXT6_9SPHN|nr:class I SAM-dependent RNA methyltransferase [Sphingomonas donggukensis]URW76471.1 class I SAM-dependent RNA methyltransferase [Sphingomonas donggukensis]